MYKELAFVIKGACCLVKYKYFRIFKKYSCDTDTLLLSAGKFNTAFAYVSIEAIGKIINKFFCTCKAGGFAYFFISSTGSAVFYIFLNSAREKINVLLNYTDIFAERFKGNVTNICSVNFNTAACDFIKAGDEVANCSFTAT